MQNYHWFQLLRLKYLLGVLTVIRKQNKLHMSTYIYMLFLFTILHFVDLTFLAEASVVIEGFTIL